MRRMFSREFKLAALSRMERASDVSALAHELGVQRNQLYRWRRVWEADGVEAWRSRGRPPGRPVGGPPRGGASSVEAADVLAAARQRIAELERKVGQQQLELDFFRRALRQIEASRRPSAGPGATASTPSSRR